SAGAGTVTSVLSPDTVWVAPPSTEYLMFLTPESESAGPASGSVAARWTLPAELCQSASALSLELGLPVSILTVAVLCGDSALPALSVAQYSLEWTPSLELSAGARAATVVVS